jgi:hypothetical protein
MKNSKFYFIIIVVIAGVFSGCFWDDRINGNGRITSTERMATEFSGIVLKGTGNINIHFSENYKVKVTTDSNIQDIVKIKAKNGVLYIDEEREESINPTKLKIDVYLPELENITLKGAGNIKIEDGNTASVLNLTLSGAGNIEAQNYKVENVNVNLSGAGNIKTWATNTLTGDISGFGNILYKGNPVKIINITGIGNVKKL